MNILPDTNSSANFTIEQMREKKILKTSESINDWEPVQNTAAGDNLPVFPDYFDFLRNNPPGCYDFLPVDM